VIETFCGAGVEVVKNASTTIHAGRVARVHHTRVQAEDLASVHVGHTRIDLDDGADVRTVSVMLGADIARHAVDVTLLGPRARAEIDGLAVPSGRQRHDHVVTVDHTASACTSRQRVRAVVDDHARSSFSGHVIVRPGTTATDADQSSRNLLLTPTAEADARPWLEILADDVQCTHGAAVGRLDDDALFYLRSRGIPLAQSRRILIGAFVRDVLDTIPHATLRADLADRVAFA
jgi:Fe-S cluster assembly protein SufD